MDNFMCIALLKIQKLLNLGILWVCSANEKLEETCFVCCSSQFCLFVCEMILTLLHQLHKSELRTGNCWTHMNCISWFNVCWSSFNRQKQCLFRQLLLYGNTSERHLLKSTTKTKVALTVSHTPWTLGCRDWSVSKLAKPLPSLFAETKVVEFKVVIFPWTFCNVPTNSCFLWVNEATQHKNSNNIKFLAESNIVLLLCFVERRKTKLENKIRQIPFRFSLFFFLSTNTNNIDTNVTQNTHNAEIQENQRGSSKSFKKSKKVFRLRQKLSFFLAHCFCFYFLFSWWFSQTRTNLVTALVNSLQH